jgi:hypothetical protein
MEESAAVAADSDGPHGTVRVAVVRTPGRGEGFCLCLVDAEPLTAWCSAISSLEAPALVAVRATSSVDFGEGVCPLLVDIEDSCGCVALASSPDESECSTRPGLVRTLASGRDVPHIVRL